MRRLYVAVAGGKVHEVSGHYAYHHYMQAGCDDTGWGCAYRSLQTIVSWLRFQAYIDKPIPSHADIQQVSVVVFLMFANYLIFGHLLCQILLFVLNCEVGNVFLTSLSKLNESPQLSVQICKT